MKILYVAKKTGGTSRQISDDTEGHVVYALERLGHEVVWISERVGEKVLKEDGDFVLFHKWDDPATLSKLKIPKVFWYFDKVDWNDREKWMKRIVPHVNLGFLTDKTWVDAQNNPKLTVLRQGIGAKDMRDGTPDYPRWPFRVCFLGNPYGDRVDWCVRLKKRYGLHFDIVDKVFNRDLYDLCATVDVFVAPDYPGDDNYWSNRIYLTLGSGGLLVHPRYKGLAEEFEDGVHYLGYDSEEEMNKQIDLLLYDKELANKIRAAGAKKVREEYNFVERCRSLVTETQQRLSIGTKG